MNIQCVLPWTQLYLGDHYAGDNHICKLCCRDITDGITYNDKESFLQFRNNPQWISFRKSMLDGHTVKDGYCNPNCLYLLNNNQSLDKYIERHKNGDKNTRTLIKEMISGEVILSSYPSDGHIITDHACNFDCIMCPTKKYTNYYLGQKRKQLIDKISSHNQLHIIVCGGEIFSSDYAKDILTEWNKNKNIYISYITNGSIFDTKILNNMNLEFVVISIDSPTKENYERIRRNSNFEILKDNIKRYVELTKERNISMMFEFVIMSINYHEIPKMIEWTYNIDPSISLEFSGVSDVTTENLDIFILAKKDRKVRQNLLKTLDNALIYLNNFPIRDSEMTRNTLMGYMKKIQTEGVQQDHANSIIHKFQTQLN